MSDHRPMRPSWMCRWCSQPWPCPVAQTQLLLAYEEAPVSLGLHMGSMMMAAMTEMPDARCGDIHYRFCGWFRHYRPGGSRHGQQPGDEH